MLTAYAAYGDRNNDIQQLSEKIVPDFVLNNISEVVDLFESVKRE
jgi:hypothetical protein